MGYPMAKNLRSGLSSDKTLLICDVNSEALSRFKEETEGQGPVETVSNGREAAKAAVSFYNSQANQHESKVLTWGLTPRYFRTP